MSNIEFEYPFLLLLIIIFIICEKFCKLKKRRLIVPHLNIFKEAKRVNKIIPILKWITIISLIVAISSPVLKHKIDNNFQDGLNIAIILDSSMSMAERGFDRENRDRTKWESVKIVASNFIDNRIDDNLSVIVFGDTLFTAAPLTYDKDMLKDILKYLEVGVAGRKTAINDAIVGGVNMLKDKNSKIIILLTDGYDTASTIPNDIAVKLAQKYSTKIYTIGVGNSRNFDKNMLKNIASKSGGEFFAAENIEQLSQVYKKIDELEKSQIKRETPIYYDFLYIYPLFLAFFAMLTYTYLVNRRSL